MGLRGRRYSRFTAGGRRFISNWLILKDYIWPEALYFLRSGRFDRRTAWRLYRFSKINSVNVKVVEAAHDELRNLQNANPRGLEAHGGSKRALRIET